MEITIGICDDSPEQVALLAAYLKNHADGRAAHTVTETDPLRFLKGFEKTPPQLVFLDIDMGEMNGIRLGEAIKERCPDTLVVYITAYAQYACEAFGLRAFHYLLKPVTEEAFRSVLEEAFAYIERLRARDPVKTWSVRSKGEIVSLRYDQIRYFEKIGHRIRVHADAADFYYYGKFITLLGEIDSQFFAQCHQGYVVNIDKIRAFRDKTLFLEGGAKLPVSRTFTEHVKEVLSARLFAGRSSNEKIGSQADRRPGACRVRRTDVQFLAHHRRFPDGGGRGHGSFLLRRFQLYQPRLFPLLAPVLPSFARPGTIQKSLPPGNRRARIHFFPVQLGP